MKQKALQLFAISCLGLMLTGCSQDNHRIDRQKNANLADNPASKKAIAVLKGTKDNNVRGTVTFTKVNGGIKVVANIEGLTPGLHGFHVHEKADCSGDGSGAGDHFNPTNNKHGAPTSSERHVGDLGNIEADDQGIAHYEFIDSLIGLSGPNSIIGRAVIVHEKEDDFQTQPTGNSGKRLACGVVTVVE